MEARSLDGTWEVRRAGGEAFHDATVPGGVYGDLLAAGEIDHPYDRDNELDLQWISETDWEYRRTVTVTEDLLDHDRVVLECDGLDTVATVLVNGETVGTGANMHHAHAFDVADALDPGENDLAVRFESPVEYARQRAEEHPHEVPALRYPVDQPHRNFVRKAQCHFGWDWGPCLPTMGIWRSIRLVAHSAPRIESVRPHQHHEDGDVELDVCVGLDVPRSGEYTLDASVAGTDAATTRTVELDAEDVNVSDGAADTEVGLSLSVERPDLWWPAGHGDQPLYDLEVAIEGEETAHEVTERLGFREVELVREPDEPTEDGRTGDDTSASGATGADDAAPGESFFLRVNGEPVFLRGANWIPTDALYRAATDERYDRLLADAAAANMNAIRVWGGGYYERDAFYDRCDELGLLVWQDFMFACAQYPADDAFVDSVETEARYQVRRLSSHPSVALWCGNNELEVGIESWFADHEHADRLEADYDRLFRETLAAVVESEDPTRPYWSASPSSGPDRVDPENEARGDIHYWGVWHEGKPFSAFLDTRPRFVSEFGYQSFPSVDGLREVIPDDQLNPTAPLMEHHQRNPGGNARVLSRMTDHFRMPGTFEDFTYLSQVQQGLAIRTAVEHWRRSKPRCMGALYWQLDDLWPCASWSSIEYGGRWKALHHMARRFYEPVRVSLAEAGADGQSDDATGNGADGDSSGDDPDELAVWVTSDERQPVSGRVTVEATTFDGERVFGTEFAASLDPGESARVGTIEVADAIGETPRTELLFRATPDGLGASFPAYRVLAPYKRLALPDPEIEVAVEDGAVTLSASATALFVALGTDGGSGGRDDADHDHGSDRDDGTDSGPVAEFDGSGRFADNYFHLPAGTERTVAYEPRSDAAMPTDDALAAALTVTHLADTY